MILRAVSLLEASQRKSKPKPQNLKYVLLLEICLNYDLHTSRCCKYVSDTQIYTGYSLLDDLQILNFFTYVPKIKINGVFNKKLKRETILIDCSRNILWF